MISGALIAVGLLSIKANCDADLIPKMYFGLYLTAHIHILYDKVRQAAEEADALAQSLLWFFVGIAAISAVGALLADASHTRCPKTRLRTQKGHS